MTGYGRPRSESDMAIGSGPGTNVLSSTTFLSPVSIMTQTPAGPYECDGCGACCGAYLIFASVNDAIREPRIASETQKLAEWLETPRWAYRLHPLPFHEACCFLDADRRCAIHATRPDVCREFAAGSDPCQRARAMKNLPPLSPVDCPTDELYRTEG